MSAFLSSFPAPPGFNPDEGLGGEEYEPQVVDSQPQDFQGAILPTHLDPKHPFSQASQSGNVRAETVAVAFAAYGLSAPLRAALLKAFECGEDESAEAMATTPEQEVEEILEETLVDDTRPPTRIEKGACTKFLPQAPQQYRAIGLHTSTAGISTHRVTDA